MQRFYNFPISPHIGSTFGNFLKVIRNGPIEPRYYIKIFLTGLVILIATPFHFWDYIWFRKKLRDYRFLKEPLFIIGHWRSGTTLLHNCLCLDKTHGYLTTYHSLFPFNLKSEFLFKTLCKIGIPAKRPSDNMKMNLNYPQEEELAFGNVYPNFYYNFFYFPAGYREFYEKAVHLDVPAHQTNAWKRAYVNLLKKAAINTKAERMIVKNPVNTARIQTILEMFPNAKFLFLYRNPYTVFFSTQLFFYNLLPTVWLQRVDKPFIDQMILDVYGRLMEDYYAQKHLIPQDNLLELKFEEFEENPVDKLNAIYTELLKEDFGRVGEAVTRYLKTLKKYEKNTYTVNKNAVDAVSLHLKKFITKWNYTLPEEIIVS
jgi:omega-hydroxy-beta-dihydromenaquinone-9 sulfotransferase